MILPMDSSEFSFSSAQLRREARGRSQAALGPNPAYRLVLFGLHHIFKKWCQYLNLGGFTQKSGCLGYFDKWEDLACQACIPPGTAGWSGVANTSLAGHTLCVHMVLVTCCCI